ncbi:hypothetical protein AOL_s00078g104 [Orbilia oligospora ATCC 24927]|uniref:Uncharacterized protein n=2 Tax=Orbilia oligospora TaxID=2813651 RepID=G1XB07_ARTOA|nr:hypothetical protein AOL_s00078g104 [Orbilia oligospora ATCC 24927]EGX49615.1 hypothetical protein AOL_s00078g104 [Orbilia oligospora ATCC 24927]KAF3276857.1 hypothetical protein TWF970_006034 [Orbilia oligospora]
MKATFLSTLAALISLQPTWAENAPFYTWPNVHSTGRTSKVEILTHIETRLSLAARLGLSQYHTIGDGVNIYKLQMVSSSSHRSWIEKTDVDGTVVVTVGGVGSPDAFWTETPTFEIEDSPPFTDVGTLLKKLESQAGNMMESEEKSLYSNAKGGFVDVVSPVRKTGIEISADYNEWSNFESAVGKSDASKFNKKKASDIDFFEEYMVLKSLAEKTIEQVIAEKATIFIHIGSLSTIASKDGTNSQKYQVASKLMGRILNQVVKATGEYPSVVGLIPVDSKTTKRSDNVDFVGSFDIKKSKRKEAPLVPNTEPKFASNKEDTSVVTPLQKNTNKIARPRPGCFENRDVCGNRTNNCNGRGNCIKSTTQSNCWSCICTPTVVKVGGANKTTYWGGNACQKKDVSVPFVLFVTFTIGMLLGIGWTINKMIDLGAEELPGELSAGVALVRK